jgi:hypothetical protein
MEWIVFVVLGFYSQNTSPTPAPDHAMPKRTTLLTDWVTLGTAGPTIDGRTISAEALEQAAASYDPDTYTAVINADHMVWFGNFGTVAALRTMQNSKGNTILQGRLAPNFRLLAMNQSKQRQFLSMELHPKFADTGGAYLTGLALTDSPASLGTTQLNFNRSDADGKPASEILRTVPDQFTLPATAPDQPGVLAQIRQLLNITPATENPGPQTEPEAGPDIMNDQQFKTMTDGFEKLQTQAETQQQTITAVEQKVNALSSQKQDSDDTPGDPIQQLTRLVKTLDDKVTKLEQEAPGTQTSKGTGPTDQDEVI